MTPNKNWITRILHFFYSLYAFIWFLLIMLILFPFFVAGALAGGIRGGNLMYTTCRLWADCWFFMAGIYHKNIFEQPHPGNKRYIFVSNHISYLDIPVMMKAVRKQPVRILGKAEMAKIPVFGFIYKNAAVLVDRKDVQHRFKSMLILKSVLAQNISIFICPEGTFNMTSAPLKDFYDGAFRIAIETHTCIKPILFLDTYDRLNYNSIFSLSPGKSRAVYLAEICTDGFTADDLPLLKEKVYKQMESALIRHKANWINEMP